MKKKCLLVTFILSLFLLCGCGIELTSDVKLQKNFSGTRSISCAFSSTDFSRYFKGSKNDLDNIIKKNCPSSMTYNKKTVDDTITYSFHLNFLSFNDYKKKVENILNFAPKITYQYGDSPFVEGLIYKENFSSKDLMAWLYTALYEEEHVDEDSVDKLWDLKETNIHFLGKNYKTNDEISINEMNYSSLSSIKINTTTTSNGFLERVISLYIPQKIMDQKAGQIRSYFANTNASWSNWKNGKILNIKLSASNLKSLATKTKKALHANAWTGSYKTDTKSEDPFSLNYSYKEILNFDNYITDNNTVPVTYTFNRKNVLKDNIRKKSLSFQEELAQPITSYNIATVWNNEDDIRRKFTFDFQNKLSKLQTETMKTAFQGETISDVTISTNKTSILSFIQKGSAIGCLTDLKKLFPNADFSADSQSSILLGKIYSFEDDFSLETHNPKTKGSYTFATLNRLNNLDENFSPQKATKKEESHNVSNKEISPLLKANETINTLSVYRFTGNQLHFTCDGNTAAKHWTKVLRIAIPLIVLASIALLLFLKQQTIIQWINKQKSTLESWLDQHKK